MAELHNNSEIHSSMLGNGPELEEPARSFRFLTLPPSVCSNLYTYMGWRVNEAASVALHILHSAVAACYRRWVGTRHDLVRVMLLGSGDEGIRYHMLGGS